MKKLLLAVLLLAACDDGATEPQDTDGPKLTFELRASSAVDIEAPKTVVTGGNGRIDVEGETYTVCRTNLLLPELRRTADGGYVLLVMEQETELCGRLTTGYEYDAAITRLPAGSYHLQVLFIHARGVTPPRTVFAEFVTVS